MTAPVLPPPVAPEHLTGLILAGGQGARMGGQDKGWLRWQGRPLIEYALARLAPQVGAVLISANRNLPDYARLDHPVLIDRLPDYQGPLAGLQTGLAACTTPWLITVPCDVPNFPTDLVARLATALPHAPAAYVQSAGRSHPTFTLLPRSALPVLEAYLAAGERRLMAWLNQLAAVPVDFPDERAFANFNTPDDLRQPAGMRGFNAFPTIGTSP